MTAKTETFCLVCQRPILGNGLCPDCSSWVESVANPLRVFPLAKTVQLDDWQVLTQDDLTD
jgi:hypothetical protein